MRCKWLVVSQVMTIVAVCSFSAVKCRHPSGALPGVSTMTNADGTISWVYSAPNGVVLVTEDDRVFLHPNAKSSISFSLNADTRSVSRLVIETEQSALGDGRWVTDFNFDGVPDQRRSKKSSVHEVFYLDRWYSAEPRGKALSIETDGKVLNLRFDGNRWVPLEQAN